MTIVPVTGATGVPGACMRSRPTGKSEGMSDLEHELIWNLQDTRGEADELRRIARRALVAAVSAQEAAYGRHDPWIDDAMRATASSN
jgi:hypothetical protein